MENMFWGGEVLKLESVALQEEKINEWRDTLKRAVHSSLIPLKAYAEGTKIVSSPVDSSTIFLFSAYEPFVSLMNMSIDTYIK